VLVSASTVNFALRTPGEQEVLLAGFGRWLNSLTGPVQICSHSAPADLRAAVDQLRATAPGLPHPALEAAAVEHAAFLEHLDASGVMLDRRVVVAVHEPAAAAASRLVRRAHDAMGHLAACEVQVRLLPPGEAEAVLSSAFSPSVPPCNEPGV
jgi:hypothetical protein